MRFEIGSVIFGGPTIATVLALTSVLNPITAAIVAGGTLLLGLGYVLSRTVWVDPGEVGIVTDYSGEIDKDKIDQARDITILDPGIHTLLNPFRSLNRKMPYKKDITVKLEPFEVKSQDNIDALVQADFIYQITHPRDAFTKVNSVEEAVKERVKGTLSAILQKEPYQDMNASALEKKAVKQEPAPAKQDSSVAPQANATPVVADIKQTPAPSSVPGNAFDSLAKTTMVMPPKMEPNPWVKKPVVDEPQSFAELCFQQLKKVLERWGVNVIPNSIRIISVEPKERRIRDLMEQTGILQQQAKAKLTAARQEAERMQILASAEAAATNKRAEGAVQASKTLDSNANPDALEIYKLGLQYDAVDKLANGNLIAIGGNAGASVLPSLVRTPATLHSAAKAANLNRVPSASAVSEMKDNNNSLPISSPV